MEETKRPTAQDVINNLYTVIGKKQMQLEHQEMIINALKVELEKYTTKDKETK